ncbi:MAG: hypothetical protein QM774_06835 [Gordonia sp. (in: high G+C Gram-positive bacteria)]|uniref:hypothetical protein n=1 Tax=Gordonia sp. (in: high G+C Gram-positive bacteria) TaxID=84139 RepID=UPI0039E3D26B
MGTKPITTESAPDSALAAAYARLVADGDVGVTVRALREEAGVSSAAAAAWLKAKRESDLAADVPDGLMAYLKPLWERALATARDTVAQAHADELLALADERDSALESAKIAQGRAAEASGKAAQLGRELSAAEAALVDLRAFRDHWVSEAEGARRAAAEAIASRAEADKTAATTAAELRARISELEGEMKGLRAASAGQPKGRR